MKNLLKKLLRSLYCVDIPCAVCGESISLKVWYSFRRSNTYFCYECANSIFKKLDPYYDGNPSLGITVARIELVNLACREVDIEKRYSKDTKHDPK